MANMFSLEGKNAIVVGGAGGIGQAIAQGLAQCGANVGIASRNMANLSKTAEEIKGKTGKDVKIFQVDSGDEDSVKKLVETVVAEMGTVDILVNSQGINNKGFAIEFPMDEWDKVFNLNVKGVMMCCKHFGKIMKEQKNGNIINVSSVRGVRANAGGNSAYCASKGAVDMITRTLAAELAPHNIRVNAIGPALVNTGMIAKLIKEPGRLEGYVRNIPMGRIGEPEDMAGAAVFLAGPAASFITGQILYIDGGLTAIG